MCHVPSSALYSTCSPSSWPASPWASWAPPPPWRAASATRWCTLWTPTGHTCFGTGVLCTYCSVPYRVHMCRLLGFKEFNSIFVLAPAKQKQEFWNASYCQPITKNSSENLKDIIFKYLKSEPKIRWLTWAQVCLHLWNGLRVSRDHSLGKVLWSVTW